MSKTFKKISISGILKTGNILACQKTRTKK